MSIKLPEDPHPETSRQAPVGVFLSTILQPHIYSLDTYLSGVLTNANNHYPPLRIGDPFTLGSCIGFSNQLRGAWLTHAGGRLDTRKPSADVYIKRCCHGDLCCSCCHGYCSHDHCCVVAEEVKG